MLASIFAVPLNTSPAAPPAYHIAFRCLVDVWSSRVELEYMYRKAWLDLIGRIELQPPGFELGLRCARAARGWRLFWCIFASVHGANVDKCNQSRYIIGLIRYIAKLSFFFFLHLEILFGIKSKLRVWAQISLMPNIWRKMPYSTIVIDKFRYERNVSNLWFSSPSCLSITWSEFWINEFDNKSNIIILNNF